MYDNHDLCWPREELDHFCSVSTHDCSSLLELDHTLQGKFITVKHVNLFCSMQLHELSIVLGQAIMVDFDSLQQYN